VFYREPFAKAIGEGFSEGVIKEYCSMFSIRGFGNVFFENLLSFFLFVKAIGEGHR